MTAVGTFLIPPLVPPLVPADAAVDTKITSGVAAVLTIATVTTVDAQRTMQVGVDAREAVHVTAWVIAAGQAHRLVDKHASIGSRVFARKVPMSVPAGAGHVTVRLVGAQGNRTTIRTSVPIPR